MVGLSSVVSSIFKLNYLLCIIISLIELNAYEIYLGLIIYMVLKGLY